MLSPVLEEGLKKYAVGKKLRALRLKKSMGLVQLAGHTGLSPALLSRLERGKVTPTLPTLLRVSMVFSVGLDYFFSENDDRPLFSIVRRSDRMRFPSKPGADTPAYHFESLDYPATERQLSAYYADFDATEPSADAEHAHAGVELIFVLKGKLGLTVDEEEHVLDEGDTAYFDSSVTHSYRRVSRGPCSAIVVTVAE